VEFEARTPEERDFPGIVALLRQCLRGSDIDISAVAKFILKQRSVGSVVTQSHSDSTDDEDDDDLGGTDGEVFGLATIVRLRETEVADQIVRHLTRSVAASDPRGQLSRLLSPTSEADVGLIISERIINMPPQISVPLYQTLSNEVRKAKAKNLPFNFSHYLIVSKIMVPSEASRDATVLYNNAEEEVFEPECDLILDIKPMAASEEESRVVTLSQEDFIERKKVMVFKAERLEKIVAIVKNAFPIS
jgi:protein BCP1